MSMSLISPSYIINGDQIAAGIVWKVLSDTTLGGAAATITSDTFTAPDFIKIMFYFDTPTGAAGIQTQFNADTGNNYGWRRQTNGAADVTNSNQATINCSGSSTKAGILEASVTNITGAKHVMTGTCQRCEDGNVPDSTLFGGSYNSATAITSVTMRTSAGNFPAGTRLKILGC